MANAARNQSYVGIDTNVLVAYLDDQHPQHSETTRLSKERVALNPTVVHEAYHTLVSKMKWEREEASQVLREASTDEDNLFTNQTLRTVLIGLDIAKDYGIGGRDALILACFIFGETEELVTFDEQLLSMKEIKYGEKKLFLRKPR